MATLIAVPVKPPAAPVTPPAVPVTPPAVPVTPPAVTPARATVRTSADIRTARVDAIRRVLLGMAMCAIAALLVYLAVHGFSYYTLRMEDRPLSPLHEQLRSSGTIGLKLGFLSVGMFGLLFLYPLRKRVKFLANIGSTRHWLNFHIMLGITTPMVVTFHTGFRTHGLAGLAYWTMIAVALSGFVGKYVYAKIPRKLNSVTLSMAELDEQTATLAATLRDEPLFRAEDLAPLLEVPSPQTIRKMSLPALLFTMLRIDLARPLLVSRLRRRVLAGSQRVVTLGGLLASHNSGLERVVSLLRRQSRLRVAIAFLDRTERVFHLWHVVHRPFSITFVVVIAVHIAVALAMGIWS
jgi:hypothetical protein